MSPSPPFEIQRLDHLVLRSSNVESLLSFYQLLGCQVVRDGREKIGLLQLRLGHSMLDIVDINGPIGKLGDSGAAPSVDGRNLDHFAVRVEPFSEKDILDFCAAHKIEAQSLPIPLLGADGFGPAIYVKDPDGNRLELKGPPNEDQTPPVVPDLST
ncbi:MAG: VOC family protein [Gammaproteobacteria bacterium]|nr:VOC family protein [Gammaproteobacteria bacterium]